MDSLLPRSYLFVPGNRPERFDKACAAKAGAVIIDLEDAVQPEQKSQAREHIARWLRPQHRVLVRINSAGSEWFRDDVQLCALPGIAGIVLPKAERAEDIFMIHCASGDKPIFPLIESAWGLENARILAHTRHVSRLMFGSIDFQLDLGIEGDDQELVHFRSELVLASRLAGIAPPVDGVTTALDKLDVLREETLRARRFGFGGKLCIHPAQVAHVNAFFAPTQEEVAWARRVLEAAAGSGGAAVALDGKMIDRPLILKAQRVVAEHEGLLGAQP
jgi:citrate lyase subunit beta/citryl-CoA lyase